MCFTTSVRAVYLGKAAAVRQGAGVVCYRAVTAIAGRNDGETRKFSVSALMFEYILDRPDSGVAAGAVLAGFISQPPAIYLI